MRAIHHGELDRLEIPRNALDILAQQMVAACACEDFGEDELFALMTRAPGRTARSPRADFDPRARDALRGHRDRRAAAAARTCIATRVNRRVRGRRGARLTAITSGGAIPETAQYLVVAEPEGTTVGTLDEDFAVESMAGDVFLLGTTSWRIRRVEAGPRARGGRARRRAHRSRSGAARPPAAPSSCRAEVSELARRPPGRRTSERRCPPNAASTQPRSSRPSPTSAPAAAALGAMPTTTRVVAERFFDEAGGMQLVLHAPFGARINRAWGLALRKRFCRSFNFELQAAATDNGIVISLGEQHSFPLEIVFEFLRVATVEEVLTQALLPAPMFTARWRWNASRALAIPRYRGGRKLPPPIQRMRADDLMAAVFPDQAACPENLAGEVRIPDHPLVNETIDNCLYEAMDLDGLKRASRRHRRGRDRDASPSTRPSRRRSRTKFSTPIPTPISTTRRSRSAAPAPSRCAGRLPADYARRRRRARSRGHRDRWRRKPGRRCATPTSCTRRCSRST